MPKKKIDVESKELLFQMLKKLKGDDFVDFWESLLSSAEIKDISRRLMAAKLLHEDLTYEEVEEIMGMGSNTINKIRFKMKDSPALRELFRKK